MNTLLCCIRNSWYSPCFMGTRLLRGFRVLNAVLLLLWGGNVLAATRYVGACGSPSNATIVAAIAAASAGDTILVCPGTYNEAVTVNKNNLTIRGSTGNRGDVTISNNGIPFSLTGAATTIKDMTVVSTNNKGIYRGWTASPSAYTFENLAVTAKDKGVHIDVSAKISFKNVNVTSSNENAIELEWDSDGAHIFDTVTVDAHKKGIYSANGGATFSNVSVTARDKGIEMNPKYDAVFSNVTVTSSNEAGIQLGWVATGKTLNFSDVTVSAKKQGIYVDVSGKVTFTNVAVASGNDDAIYLGWDTTGAHVFDTVTASSGNGRGIYSAHGGVTFKDLTVTATKDAIEIGPEYDAIFTNISATSSDDDGIHMNWVSTGRTLTLSGLDISAKDRGIYVDTSAALSIRNSVISSSNGDAIYLGWGAQGAHVLDNLTLDAPSGDGIEFAAAVPSSTIGNVCVNSSQRGVYISQWGSRNVTITGSKFVGTSHGVRTDADPSYKTTVSGSCFMKSAAPRAYSNSTAHAFNGNYWQGVAGGTSYVDGNVRDNATLGGCPVTSCYSGSLPLLTIATSGAAAEGNSGTSTLSFTVSLSAAATATTTATYAFTDGTATGGASCTAGVDYINTGGTVTIASGSNTGTINATLCGDTTYEADETFTLALSSPVNATLGSPSSATGTITNDDAAPTISIAAASTTEGDSGTKNLSFTVTQSAASGLATTATYALTNGTATGGGCGGAADFANAGGTVTIVAGATSGTIDVPICGDTTYESDETLTVTLSSPSNATLGTPSSATGTIVNDDVDPDGCFLDTFTGADNSAPSSNWTTTTSSGSFGAPRIFGNRLRLTDNSASVSTAAHLQRMFPGAGNKIVVEFDHFAYNGTGADGIALTFSDAAVTPQAGAFGGSLGYAQKSNPGSDCTVVGGCPGFAGGWLGIGFDEYGNFSNATEGRIGGPGSRPDRVAIRGSGSGQSGYVYHTGSALLSPGIDQSGTTPGPGHRYRVTIDHTDGVQAKVSIERSTDGGSTYATIIPQYDAKVQTGQAAVPENWLLSYTGSTGGSKNIHEIDNLKVCAVKPIVPIGPNHYVISHSGTGLTCEAEPVTFTAHDAGHSRANAGGRTLSISTSTSKGAWLTAADNCSSTCYNSVGGTVACAGTFTGTTGNNGQASYLFANGETGIRLCLKHNVATTVNINVSDGSASEATGSAAGEASPGADPALVFSDTGFRFYAGGTVDTIGNLVAGLRSDVTEATWQPSPQTIVIRALKSSETTPARCVSLLGSTAKTVKFGYECVDPNACHASSGGLEVNGAAVAGSAGVPTPASDVSVTFDGNGSGTINLKYWDVGQIKLYAQASIADAASGDVSIVTGASNGFIVKPYGFDVKACTGSTPCTTANNAATDGTGSVFVKAGDVFNATVTAVAYGGTTVTPSFGLGTGNTTETVSLTPTLVAPAGGAAGALGGTALPKRNAFTDGVANLSDLNWSEVGVMKINAANTLFQTVTSAATGASGNIGRFTPHHFGVTGTVVTRSDMQTSEGQVVPFTYMGEPMKLTLVVTAYNKAEGVTQNYKGNFAKLDAGTLGTTVANWTCTSGTQCMGLGIVSGGNLSARLGIDTASANSAVPANTTTAGGATAGWEAGTSYFSLNMVVSRDTAADGPYRNLKFGAKPRDADGVTLPPRLSTDTAHCVNLDVGSGNENPACDPGATETNLRRKLFETDLRFGRLWLGNAYGSDQRGLAVPYETQYWNGFAFVRNADDGLTPFAVGNISRVTSLTTTLALTNLSAGRGTIDLGTPNGRGTVDVYVNLDSAGAPSNCGGHAEGTTVARSYLSGKWCGTAHDRDPVARATFGIQAGRKGPIYIRENY